MKRIALIIMIMLVIFSVTLTGCTPDPVETRPIKSCVLYGGNRIQGSGIFIIGFATYEVSHSMVTKYYIFIKGAEGYRLQELNSNYVELVETNTIEPCIEGYFSSMGEVYTATYYTIYVPVGTITEEYSAELMMEEN